MANKAVGQLFGDGVWVNGDILTNPADQTVLVEYQIPTGTQGYYLWGLMAACSGSPIYDVQHRNAANSANVHSQRRRPGQGNDDWNSSNKLYLQNDERVRVILQGALVGEIQVSLWIQEVA